MYHIKHNVHTSFYHNSGLIRNWMFNPRLSNVLFVTRLNQRGVVATPLNFRNQGLYELGFGING